MATEKPGGGYVPTDVDSAIPADPEARRKRVAEWEDITTQRDILLGRMARLRSAIHQAQAAGDAAGEAALRARFASLTAERDAL